MEDKLELGQQSPRLSGLVPGPRSTAWIDVLARSECPAMTMRRARRESETGAPQDPIVWKEAVGCNVVDADRNVFVDFTSGFGAASVGHRHPAIVAAIEKQANTLIHALGDVHPSEVKLALMQRLVAMAPWQDCRVVLGQNGSDAVEVALKTAALRTGRAGCVAFEGGYHGLSYGALSVTGFSDRFRAPFKNQLNTEVRFVPYPQHDLDQTLQSLREVMDERVGAVLVEPILGRGGVCIPPDAFVLEVANLCHERGALLIIDEIMTGLGRTGALYCTETAALERTDILCLGKALGGGLPISACLGRKQVMSAWGGCDQEAIHTGTFYGNPLGCAAALASLDVMKQENLAERAATAGASLLDQVRAAATHSSDVVEVRGRGLLLGIEFSSARAAMRVAYQLFAQGFLCLTSGPRGTVLTLMPPLTIEPHLLHEFVDALRGALTATS